MKYSSGDQISSSKMKLISHVFFHTALAPVVSSCLCDMEWLTSTCSLLICCSGGDTHYVSAEEVSESPFWEDAQRRAHVHINRARGDSLSMGSNVILEQTRHISDAVCTTLKTNTWDDSLSCCLWQDLKSFTAWDGHLMNNEACRAKWKINSD